MVGRTCNEALEGLSIPRAAIADLVRERTDARRPAQTVLMQRGGDDALLAGEQREPLKRVDDWRPLLSESKAR